MMYLHMFCWNDDDDRLKNGFVYFARPEDNPELWEAFLVEDRPSATILERGNDVFVERRSFEE